MTNQPSYAHLNFVEVHIPTRTSKDTLVQIRARSRTNLVSGIHHFIDRENAKGEIVTWGSNKEPLTCLHAASAPKSREGSYHVVTLRIRRS